jgi:hypothetical protein
VPEQSLLEIVLAVPVILGLSTGTWLILIQSFGLFALCYQLHVIRRARWATEHNFAPIEPVYATFNLCAALPGLSAHGQPVRVFAAYEQDGFLVGDVGVRAPHASGMHADGVESWQTMTVARALLDRPAPRMEVRPWTTWPPDPRHVAQRALTGRTAQNGPIALPTTVTTNDPEFDAQFVVRAEEKQAARELLTPGVRHALQSCPAATVSLTSGALLVAAPRLFNNAELDGLLTLVTQVRFALQAGPLAA